MCYRANPKFAETGVLSFARADWSRCKCQVIPGSEESNFQVDRNLVWPSYFVHWTTKLSYSLRNVMRAARGA